MRTPLMPPPVQNIHARNPEIRQSPGVQRSLYAQNLYVQSLYAQNPLVRNLLSQDDVAAQDHLPIPSLLLLLLLLQTLGSSPPPTLTNRTTLVVEEQVLQGLLASNLRDINHINHSLQRYLSRPQPPGGANEGDPKICKKTQRVPEVPRSLPFRFLLQQESVLGLQEAVVRRRLGQQPSEGVRSLLEVMLQELGSQRARLGHLRALHESQDRHPHQHLDGCLPPFFALGGECFYLSLQVKLGWHKAKAACDAMDAHLARPRHLRAMANFLHKFPGDYRRCWIGGSDEEVEGDWRWVTGQSVSGGDWRLGQPSNYSRQGEEQDCLALVKTPGGNQPLLDDYSCHKKRAFLCQKDLDC